MNSPEEKSPEKPAEGDFMRLFLRHEPVLRAYARTILPDWNSIDDALQEASVTMWQKLGQLEDEDGFLPWAKVIVRYKCLHAIDDLRRERPLLSDRVLKMLADEAETTTVSDFTELRRTLNVCMAEFNQSHQELLLAPYGGAGRVKELAAQSGKTANALYKLLGRLREKLTGCIQTKMRTAGA